MESRRLRTKDAAVYLGITKSTLEKDRVSGQWGIPFIRMGSAIVYDTRRLDEWMLAKAVQSTSETLQNPCRKVKP